MILQTDAKEWCLQDLKVNHPGTVDIATGEPPGSESVNIQWPTYCSMHL